VPELPEVEIASRNLSRWMNGRFVTTVLTPDTARFEGEAASLIGHRFLSWRRVGKYLVGELDGGSAVISHLGMTGQWVANAPETRAHQRVVFTLDGDGPRTVSLVDPRRFGWTWIVRSNEVATHPRLVDLGPDPLAEGFDVDLFRGAVGQGTTLLKSRLMNQRVISGLGNIAISEIGWRARVHPHGSCASILPPQWESLWAATLDHLRYVLEVEDEEEIDYQSSAGAKNPFLCYGREGAPCSRCDTPFARQNLSGRVTFYCPTCQEPPP
jgi:formamidopyrimidine-DNA glycosylase